MIKNNRFKKIIALVVIISFIFYSDFFLYAQTIEIEEQFQKAINEYNNRNYSQAIGRIERVIALNPKQILGKCYLLLGAAHEKRGDHDLAIENYEKAIEEYNTASIEEINLVELSILKEVLFREAINEYENKSYTTARERIERVIALKPKQILGKCYLLLGAVDEKMSNYYSAEQNYRKAKDLGVEEIEGIELGSLKRYQKIFKTLAKEPKEPKKKKKFPWLLVAGGVVVVVGVVLYFTVLKKKKFDLNVSVGTGVTGSPSSGTTTYKKGETVSYSYTLQPGYSDLRVTLDGVQVAASGTITMDKGHTLTATSSVNETGFVTDREEVTVPEGSTAEFKVKLSEQPVADVNVMVNRHSGDNDITVQSGSSLTFTPSNWNTYQTITLAAAEDGDTQNGTAVIRISAPGITEKDITAVEQDNDNEDELMFVTDTERVTVPEEGTADFQVKLSTPPPDTVTASVSRTSGDSDITVQSGSSLTFTPSNWDTYQTVTLAAENDADNINGEAVIQISGAGLPDKEITAVEQDNDNPRYITNMEFVNVPEGGKASFRVKLSGQPGASITANVSRISGDSDITVRYGSSLTFTTTNWATYQTVVLAAANDPDGLNGAATIRISGGGLVDKDITAFENDRTPITKSINITRPVGGELWVPGTYENITWTATNVTNGLTIILKKDGAVIGNIAKNVSPLSGSYTWEVSKYIGGEATPGYAYTIEIKEDAVGGVSDESTSFSIKGITILSPNGGEVWQIGTIKRITWEEPGVTHKLNIILYRSGFHYGDIAGIIDPGMGYYDWYVGKLQDGTQAPPGSDYQIRITSVDGNDISDGYFMLIE